MSSLLLLAALLAPPMPALTAARADVDRAEHQVAALATERATVQQDLDRLAGEIARRKASLPARAEPPQDLLAMLQRSTLLAQQIESLERRTAAAQATAQLAQQHLAEVCARQAKELEQWSNEGLTGAEARGSLQTSLSELEKHCATNRVTRDEPAGRVVPAATLEAAPSDDAQRLRQKADFLRDREDRLRRQVAMLDQRIDALSRERVLQHRVSEFLQESSLFDEDDRRVARSELLIPAGKTGPTVEPSQIPAGGAAPATQSAAFGPAATATATSTAGKTSDSVSATQPAPAATATPSPAATTTRSALLQRPEDPPLEGATNGSEDSLEALNARRGILAAEADRLHIAALALEQASDPR